MLTGIGNSVRNQGSRALFDVVLEDVLFPRRLPSFSPRSATMGANDYFDFWANNGLKTRQRHARRGGRPWIAAKLNTNGRTLVSGAQQNSRRYRALTGDSFRS